MIPVAEPYFVGNEKKYVNEAIDSGWVSSIGEFIGRFEKGFADYCGVKHASSCCNGTAALHLALKAYNIKEGDEVIVPDFTFVATAAAVKYCNAKPIPVDVEEKTWNLNPDKIEEKITSNTKAIIPVHIYGCPAKMDEINEIAEKHSLKVIEDAAESHGAEYKKKKTGSLGDCGTFSFYGNKNITTGEGGIITSNDSEFIERINFLKDNAMNKEKRYWHNEIGYNYRMTNIQAAFGLAQLEGLDKINQIKRNNAKLYSEKLSEIGNFQLPFEPDNCKNIFWLYTLLLEKKTKVKRDKLIKKLKQRGIETRNTFYPISQMQPYKSEESFPVSFGISERGISLPSSAKISEKEIDYVCESIKEILE